MILFWDETGPARNQHIGLLELPNPENKGV
jgi:hypothetical protein